MSWNAIAVWSLIGALSGAAEHPQRASFQTGEVLNSVVDQVRKRRVACGPLSAVYCLTRLGYDVAAEDLIDKASLTDDGATVGQVLTLIASVHKNPVYAVNLKGRNLDTLPLPAVLVLYDRHCVVMDAVTPGRERPHAHLFDPAYCELRTMDINQLSSTWSGDAIVFEKPTNWYTPMAFGMLLALVILVPCRLLATRNLRSESAQS